MARKQVDGRPELTLEAVAKHFGVLRPAVMIWKRQMVAAGLRWVCFQEIANWRQTKAEEVSPTDLNALKKQKLEREVKRLDLRIAEDERKLIPVDQVEEQAQTAGAILCSEGKAMIGDLPGQLAGLPEVQIRQRLETRWNQLLANTKARLRAVALGGSLPDLTEG